MRLIRRETFIRDALLQLARFLDEELRVRAHQAALGLGLDRGRAQALAAAVTILDAVETRRNDPDAPGTGDPDTLYLLQEIQAVSEALHHTDEIKAVRAAAAVPAESMSTHE